MSQRHFIQNNLVMHVTTVTLHREPFFKDDAVARMAIDTLFDVQKRYPFTLFAFVIMPDHVHMLVRVPPSGSISKIMNVYKSALTFNTGIRQLWQPRFHVRIVHDLPKVRQYIHDNPRRAGLSTHYPWSSASGRWP